MPKGSNITKKQHYIPQVYLRGFSPEYHEKGRDASKHTIFCYDLTGRNSFMDAVPIRTICYEENLYEVTDSAANVVFPNRLERFFAEFERRFGIYRQKLETKVFIEDKYTTSRFLTSEEKDFWIVYILIQILRLPQVLKLAEEVSAKIWKNQIDTNQSKNIARTSCLPFFKKLEEDSKEGEIIKILFEPMKDMSLGVGVDRQARIITADNPVYVEVEKFPCKEYKKVIFPITSEICLFLLEEDKENYPKNFLFPISDGIQEEIFRLMTYTSFGKLYSNHLLNERERIWVKEVLEEKEASKCHTLIL